MPKYLRYFCAAVISKIHAVYPDKSIKIYPQLIY